jgi:hypothetical protein
MYVSISTSAQPPNNSHVYVAMEEKHLLSLKPKLVIRPILGQCNIIQVQNPTQCYFTALL